MPTYETVILGIGVLFFAAGFIYLAILLIKYFWTYFKFLNNLHKKHGGDMQKAGVKVNQIFTLQLLQPLAVVIFLILLFISGFNPSILIIGILVLMIINIELLKRNILFSHFFWFQHEDFGDPALANIRSTLIADSKKYVIGVGVVIVCWLIASIIFLH